MKRYVTGFQLKFEHLVILEVLLKGLSVEALCLCQPANACSL
jgi:hypothetical protein